MGPACPLSLARASVLSSHSLHRALQLPGPPAISRRSLSLFSSSPPDPYRYRVTITPHAPTEEVLPNGKKKPGPRQWLFLTLMVSANLFLVKILLERVGERRLQSLEKERVALVAEGAAIRKLLQIARKEWLKADVQEKKQAIMMREGSVEVNERMDELCIRAEELRDEWVTRDIREKAISLFTDEEKVALAEERSELEGRLMEQPTVDSDQPESPSTNPAPTTDDGPLPLAESRSLSAQIADIDSRLAVDAQATEAKAKLVAEKSALIEEAKISNEEARVLRSDWADKDLAERARRLHLKHEKKLLADQATELTSKLDEVDKSWQQLKRRISDAKGIKRPDLDLPDSTEEDETELASIKDEAEGPAVTGVNGNKREE